MTDNFSTPHPNSRRDQHADTHATVPADHRPSTASPAAHHVDFISRSTCGSCQRVLEQIRPIVEHFGATLTVVEVDASGVDQQWAMEFGDRVPVVLVDDEEIGCWEIDDEDLITALQG